MQIKKTNLTRPQTPKQQTPRENLFEAIRGIGQNTQVSLKEDLLKETSQEFFEEFGRLLRFEKPRLRGSGNLERGEFLEIDTVIQEQDEEKKKRQLQLAQEHKLREEDRILVEEKTNSLRLQIQELANQTQKLAKSTYGLSREVKIAAMQAPVEPGTYHLSFFEKLISYIRDFRKKIEDASAWLHCQNQRSIKMRLFWGQVGRAGAKRLLSTEDYMTRSAG